MGTIFDGDKELKSWVNNAVRIHEERDISTSLNTAID